MKDKDLIMAVDEEDRFLEERDKWECHRGEGILHRAFLVMVFNDEGDLMLARRSPGKKLWPGFWDGTVASHVRLGESYEDAACRRLDEELGFNGAHVSYVTKFKYHARYQEVGSEREVCAVLTTNIPSSAEIIPCEQEITEIRYMPPEAVPDEANVSPWLLLAIEKVFRKSP
jgi:isopentenyl-diphosphate delta-isomerase